MAIDWHHLFTSLTQLRSFSHARCDAILQSRQIEIVNAYDPRKEGWWRDAVYFGFFWVSGWLLFVLTGLIGAWRSKDAKAKVARLILPFFLLFGFGGLYLQLQAMAQYVDACQRLLSSSAVMLPHPRHGDAFLGLLEKRSRKK